MFRIVIFCVAIWVIGYNYYPQVNHKIRMYDTKTTYKYTI